MTRQTVSRLSAVLVFVAFGLFAAFYVYREYQCLLLGVFAIVLGGCHIALTEGALSTSAIRKMDFAYVACACFAGYLGVQSSQSQADRDPYVRWASELDMKRQAWFLPFAVGSDGIARYARAEAPHYCEGPAATAISYEPKFCQWISRIAETLARAPDPDDLDRLYVASKAEADAAVWNTTAFCQPPPKASGAPGAPALPTLLSEADRLQLCVRGVFVDDLLQGLDIMVRRARLKTPHPPAPAGTTFFGLTKTLLWPLIVAVALALRLTKATADVTGWATSFGAGRSSA